MTLLTIILLLVAIGLCIARFFVANGKLTAAAVLCLVLINVLSESAHLAGFGH